MRLRVDNLRARIVEANDDEVDWLDNYLVFGDSSARFSGRASSTVRMFNRWGRHFPAGLLPLVAKAAERDGVELAVGDLEFAAARAADAAAGVGVDLTWLRDYQLDAVEAALRHGRGVVRAPTGSGKGSIAAALVARLPVRWLYLVHRSSLVEQQAERNEAQAGVGTGRTADGRWEGFGPERRVVCASFQTILARLGSPEARALLDAAEGLLVDEVHVAGAAEFNRVAMATPNARWRVGLSATPLDRSDGRSALIVGALGPVIHRVEPAPLVARGLLAKTTVRMLPVWQTSNRPTWQGVVGELVVRSRPRNAAIVAAARLAEKPCLVFVRELDHALRLERLLSRAGLSVGRVDGGKSTAWRRSHARRLVSGALDVLISTVVMQEGIDLPELRSVVVASGGASSIAALQRIGRAMRPAPGKRGAEVWDVLDVGHGWLERHARRRARAYRREGHLLVEGVADLDRSDGEANVLLDLEREATLQREAREVGTLRRAEFEDQLKEDLIK